MKENDKEDTNTKQDQTENNSDKDQDADGEDHDDDAECNRPLSRMLMRIMVMNTTTLMLRRRRIIDADIRGVVLRRVRDRSEAPIGVALERGLMQFGTPTSVIWNTHTRGDHFGTEDIQFKSSPH